MAGTVRIQVRDGWAVHDGTRHRTGGETVDTDAATAEQWIANGWADKIEPAKAKAKGR